MVEEGDRKGAAMIGDSQLRLSFAFMAVPQRRSHVESVAERIRRQASGDERFAGVDVFYDVDRRGCWHGWSSAWAAHRQWPGVTHHVVLQDDILVCDDFPQTMLALASARSDDWVSGFLPRKSVTQAVEQGCSWVRTTRFLWAQCVMAPVEQGDACLAWVSQHEQSQAASDWKIHDDVRIAAWLKTNKRPMFVAVPHPVQHIGDELEGGSVMKHNGKPELRRARAWLGEQGRGAARAWSDLRFVRE